MFKDSNNAFYLYIDFIFKSNLVYFFIFIIISLILIFIRIYFFKNLNLVERFFLSFLFFLFFLYNFIFFFCIFCFNKNIFKNILIFDYMEYFDIYKNSSFFFNNFQLVLIFISNLLILISFNLIFNFSGNKKILNIKICFYFFFITFFFFVTKNIVYFFLLYELLLIPSFIIVNFLSTNKKSLNCSYYFLIWTQIGSLLVFLGMFYIIYTTNIYNFSDISGFYFTKNESFLLYSFFFFGFGFKVPVWPFHYWLTKTHVEATAGFSIYLSGFLVKTALYGFYKYTCFISEDVDNFFFTTICVFSIVDSSLKFWMQTDLKKLVAYCTVQEMNCIYLLLCWNDSFTFYNIINFCFSHSVLSCLMFFIVDCIQKRYNSRSVLEVSGIMNKAPNLGTSILFICIIYSGVPFSLKFYCEFYFFSAMLENSYNVFFVLILITNFIGIVGFCKNWFEVVFGISKNDNIVDLDKKESIIISFLILLSIFSIFVV